MCLGVHFLSYHAFFFFLRLWCYDDLFNELQISILASNAFLVRWALVLFRTRLPCFVQDENSRARTKTLERWTATVKTSKVFSKASRMQYVGYVSFLKGHVVCHSLPPWMIHVIHRTLCGLASHNFSRCMAKASLIPWNASVLTKNVNDRCMTVVLRLCQPRPLPCLPEQALKQIPCSIVSSTWFSYLEGGEKKAHDFGVVVWWLLGTACFKRVSDVRYGALYMQCTLCYSLYLRSCCVSIVPNGVPQQKH